MYNANKELKDYNQKQEVYMAEARRETTFCKLYESAKRYSRNNRVSGSIYQKSAFEKGIHETTEYLEAFLRNLLLNEKNELHNRNIHISGLLNEEKVDIGDSKEDFENEKVDIQDKKVDICKI